MTKFYFSLLVSGFVSLASAIEVTILSSELTPENLASYLLGEVDIQTVTYVGSDSSAGLYKESTVEAQSSVLLQDGVILSSGYAYYLNSNENLFEFSTGTFEPAGAGDADLQSLARPDEWGELPVTYDATFLEIEFLTYETGDITISFDYVFGSEEYEEYVHSDYNDVFGVFLDGVNVAVVPGTSPSEPVSVHTINQETNTTYYNSNIINTSTGGSNYATEMDGFTTPLHVEFTLAAGTSHTLKIGIADVRDDQYDSWVLINSLNRIITPVGVPEPSPLLLILLGSIVLAVTVFRRKQTI